MADNPNQPKEYDVVKGGQAPPPPSGVILGGIEGVKNRLASGVEEQRIAALFEALNYGEAGLELSHSQSNTRSLTPVILLSHLHNQDTPLMTPVLGETEIPDE